LRHNNPKIQDFLFKNTHSTLFFHSLSRKINKIVFPVMKENEFPESNRRCLMESLVDFHPTRREFIKKGGVLMASTAILQTDVALTLAASGSEDKKAEGKKGEEVSPAEDLMREHGVLARILLIYDEISVRLGQGQNYPPAVLTNAAGLVRRFVEDYHEKLEEDHVFPRFVKAGKLLDLVNVLPEQHQAGRRLTEKIKNLGSLSTLNPDGKRDLLKNLALFARMYRPHKSREDTVLFPAFHSIVSEKEYDALGEKFEEQEDKLFGEHGFEKVVEQVGGLEKSLGIYELSQFTPKD
jgi:hemerythrin-like domain-containing protein